MSEPLDINDTEKINAAIRENGGKGVPVSMYVINGIYGELNGCFGIAEAILDRPEAFQKYGLDPNSQGTYIKIIGCTYLYKGDPAEARVFGIEQAKSNISTVPRDIIGKSVIYVAAVALRFLLQPKRFVNDLHIYFNEIKHKTIRHQSQPLVRYNGYSREIMRAMEVSLKNLFKIDQALDLMQIEPTSSRFTNLDIAGLLMKATAFMALMFELDGAYRFPAQDTLGEKNTELAKKSGWREMIRLMNILIARNTNLTPIEGISDRTQGVPNKFRFVKYCLLALFLLSPMARRIVQAFLVELDEKKVALDEADWYFCLRRNTHNYRGISLPARLKELEEIDKAKGHYYVKIEYKPAVQQPPTDPQT